jgi:hypothetical protein
MTDTDFDNIDNFDNFDNFDSKNLNVKFVSLKIHVKLVHWLNLLSSRFFYRDSDFDRWLI